VRSASFVLLQGVPSTISLEQVRAAILAVEGVQSLHELHIWQVCVVPPPFLRHFRLQFAFLPVFRSSLPPSSCALFYSI
jgi:Co/Zn/Cd efflux system component